MILRERELPVVPPAERLLRLLEQTEAVFEAKPDPIPENCALGLGAHHLSAPEVRIVDVALLRRNIEVSANDEARVTRELRCDERRRSAAPVELVLVF